ncbi:Cof-type HAD-IIB family hydrolase [Staphylococcus saccharolyticus]|uniref:Cof-type HAD-IIB family hydrolase n=1 Tax=Staphylococcus saccharolyticus TaxID=33028 RepID=UPI0032DF9AB5
MIKAIAVYMDGTFLDTNKQFDQSRFEEIFKKLKDKGIIFIVVSGNQYAKLKSIFGVRDMFFISKNGVVIYKGNEMYSYCSFNRDIFQSVVDDLNINNKIDQLIICGVKSAYILKNTSENFKEDARLYYHQLEEIDSLQALPDDDYVKIAFNLNRETHPRLDKELGEIFKDSIKLVSSGRDSIDIIMPNMTKGQALTRLLNEWNMSPDDLMAFGDANNDIDMLELAKHSYAMANSEDALLCDIASAVAPSNDEQGVLTTIEKVVLGYS